MRESFTLILPKTSYQKHLCKYEEIRVTPCHQGPTSFLLNGFLLGSLSLRFQNLVDYYYETGETFSGLDYMQVGFSARIGPHIGYPAIKQV